MRKFFLAFVFMSLLFSCKKNSAKDDINDTSLARVYLNGVLKVGVNIPFAPLCFLDRGEKVGYDIDVLNEVCAILDVVPEYVVIDWEEKDKLLASGEIDMIASGFSKTPEREKEYGMSLPLLKNAQCIVVREDEKRFKTFADLETFSVACNTASTAEYYIQDKIKYGFGIRFNSYKNIEASFIDLKTHEADAVMVDIVLAKYFLSKEKNSRFKILQEAILPEEYVYAFRKEDKVLIDAVNSTLKIMAEDGVLTQITKKWFTNDISLIR